MDLSPFVSTGQPTRHDGWNPERKLRFLDRLAACGNVRSACACAGMSRDSAYALRRRDGLFARGWAAALELAREKSVEVLADMALEGFEEEVWYRGELLGTRRRFDPRLLLAHVARLDRMAEEAQGSAEDAARFEEILACIAGVQAPEELKDGEDALPLDRETAMTEAEADARAAAEEASAGKELDDEEYAAYLEELESEAASARAIAGARWDAWFESACRTVDSVLAGGASFSSRTVSDVSVSAAAEREDTA